MEKLLKIFNKNSEIILYLDFFGQKINQMINTFKTIENKMIVIASNEIDELSKIIASIIIKLNKKLTV